MQQLFRNEKKADGVQANKKELWTKTVEENAIHLSNKTNIETYLQWAWKTKEDTKTGESKKSSWFKYDNFLWLSTVFVFLIL